MGQAGGPCSRLSFQSGDLLSAGLRRQKGGYEGNKEINGPATAGQVEKQDRPSREVPTYSPGQGGAAKTENEPFGVEGITIGVKMPVRKGCRRHGIPVLFTDSKETVRRGEVLNSPSRRSGCGKKAHRKGIKLWVHTQGREEKRKKRSNDYVRGVNTMATRQTSVGKEKKGLAPIAGPGKAQTGGIREESWSQESGRNTAKSAGLCDNHLLRPRKAGQQKAICPTGSRRRKIK